MNGDWATGLIGLVSGGSLTVLANLVLDHARAKQSVKAKEIDDRIVAWQKINDRTELRLEDLERKLESYDRDCRSLERYVNSLERIILRIVPPVELPDKPLLERDLVSTKITGEA